MYEHTKYVQYIKQTSVPMTITGTVESVHSPLKKDRFYLRVKTPEFLQNAKLRLSWRQPIWNVQQGQKLRVVAKISVPQGLNNHYSFDYKRWLLSESCHGTGYVIEHDDNQLLDKKISYRQSLINRLMALSLSNQHWLMALVLGYRGEFTDAHWQGLRDTGTAHLMAISGLHLALIVGSVYCLLRYLFAAIAILTRKPFVNIKPLAMAFTVLLAGGYAILTGASPPIIRACLMLLLVFLCLMSGRRFHRFHYCLYVLFLFVILQPWCFFSSSVWMSMSAVLCVWFLAWRWPYSGQHLVFWTIRFQLLLSILMMPLVAYLFGVIAWLSPLINLIAVPVVTFILLPLALISTAVFIVLPDYGSLLLTVWDTVLNQLFLPFDDIYFGDELTTNNSIPLVLHVGSIEWFVWLAIFVVVLSWHLPLTYWYRPRLILSFVTIAGVSGYHFFDKNTELTLDILDVGHGLSVLVSHHQKAILYDTGAKYPSGFSMAKSVVIPTLRGKNILNLDILFVSHDDNDHSGGVEDLQKRIAIEQILTPHNTCHNGMQIQWRETLIQGIWPPTSLVDRTSDTERGKKARNNDSCVLVITWENIMVVLAGDIEADKEHAMLSLITSSDLYQKFKLDNHHVILIAPHHGSKSSSSQAFVDFFKPNYVVFSHKEGGRWKLPHKQVVDRYLAASSVLLSTGQKGQITFQLNESGVMVSSYADVKGKRWYD